MQSQELKRIAEKIAKCLALANSSNPQEAETAKRQAEALMRQYNLTAEDVGMARVNEKNTQELKAESNHPRYLRRLGMVIKNFFGCDVIYTLGNVRYATFVGMGHKPELASYVFDVLRRQINNDRVAYRKTLTRYKPSNKTKLCDIFCDAWVANVAKKVQVFSGSAQEKQLISAYVNKMYPNLTFATSRQADVTTLSSSGIEKAALAGAEAGKKASLHHAVNGKAEQAQLLS